MTAEEAVVEVIGNPRAGSRTRGLADAVTEQLVGEQDRHVLELGDIVGISYGAEPAYGSAAVVDPFEVVRSARLLVVATPTYKGTYSGLLKVFLDNLGQSELAGAVGVPVAVAAVEEHRRSVQAALRDLLVELGVSVPAPPVAVLESELESSTAVGIATDWTHRYGSVIADALEQDRATVEPR